MTGCRTLLLSLLSLAGCQPLPPPVGVLVGPPVGGQGWIAAPPVPQVSPPQRVILPPVMEGPPLQPLQPQAPLSGIAPDGMVSPQFGLPAGPDALPGIPNPLLISVTDDELAWDQVADMVSDYFPIASEQRARRSEGQWVEGRIETAPQGGATILEPHRHDSVGRFNRWESTFQTIRRRAIVRVIPEAAGYQIEIAVHKELEDLPRPERATAGAASLRHDGSLPTNRVEPVSRILESARWLPLGRDLALEQRMLADLQARLGGATTVQPPIFAAP